MRTTLLKSYRGRKDMDKKPLIVVSFCAVVLLVLASLGNVVAYKTYPSQYISSLDQKTQSRKESINWTINGTMGENDWFVSPVIITCSYDHEIYAQVYYEYDENHSGRKYSTLVSI
jgi:hypothetical protein